MIRHSIGRKKVAPPLVSACALPHHAPGSWVGWQFWATDTERWEWVVGTVIEHLAESRWMRIRLLNTVEVSRPCGYILPAHSAVAP